MEWVVLVFYVFGLCCGLYLGYNLGVEYSRNRILLNIRNRIQSLSDEVEVRLQDMDYGGKTKEQLMDLGRQEVCFVLLEFMDNEYVIEK